MWSKKKYSTTSYLSFHALAKLVSVLHKCNNETFSIKLGKRYNSSSRNLPGGSWMFWMFVELVWGWVTRGASTCWVTARIAPAGALAIVDGVEVLSVCKTVGLLTMAAGDVTTWPPDWMIVLAESTLLTAEPVRLLTQTAVDVVRLCEALEGVCIGGLESVTVGTLCAAWWEEITVFSALAGEVLVIALGAMERTAELSLLAVTGPLLTVDTAGCGSPPPPPVSTDAPPETWQFTSTVLPFKVCTPAVPLLSTPGDASDTVETTPPAIPLFDCVWVAVMLGPAADAVPVGPSMLEAWELVLLTTPPRTSAQAAAEAHENKTGVEQLPRSE